MFHSEENSNTDKYIKYPILDLIIKVLTLVIAAYLGNKLIDFHISFNKESKIQADADAKAESKLQLNQQLIQTTTKLNNKDTIISRKFDDAIQACWYYHAHYENLYPYTVMWDEKYIGRDYPRIRVIASKAYWIGQECIQELVKENNNYMNVTKLIGAETVTHRVEAQFDETSDFRHIATATGEYSSELIFDKYGRITGRKILGGGYHCEAPKFTNEYGIKLSNCQSASEYSNSIKLEPNPYIEKKDYRKTDYIDSLNLYIDRRFVLHSKLQSDGCGVITLEPGVLEDSQDYIIRPSVVFLCYKDGSSGKSHVRVMVRK